ncbi:hypothetical protein LDC_0706, partial [sediment metagenome]
VISGVEDQESNSGLTITPNPGNGVYNIGLRLNASSDLSISVTDINGADIYKKDYISPERDFQAKIDISKSPAGVYFLMVKAGVSTWEKKIIKN